MPTRILSRPFVWIAGLLLAAAGAAAAYWFVPGLRGDGGPTHQEHHLNFQGMVPDPAVVERVGPDAEQCVTFEPAGLRIALPAGYAGRPGYFGERPDTGVTIPVLVKGDFEITVDFEILKEPPAEDAGRPQTRFTLDVGVDRMAQRMTTLSRRVVQPGGKQYLAWMRRPDETTGKDMMPAAVFPARTQSGKLRLVRTGATVSYLVAEAGEADFTLFNEFPFSDEALEDVRLVGSTGKGPNSELEVRVTDLRIRGAALKHNSVGSHFAERWLVLGVVGGLVAVLAVGLAIAGRARGGAAIMSANPAAPSPAADADNAAPMLQFRCEQCGKGLKVKPEHTGLRVKCPQCGNAQLVAPSAS